MNTLSRFLTLFCLIAVDLISIRPIPAQNLPNTTRLLRFPTTNGSQIVFCYAGELYTVAKGRRDSATPDEWTRLHFVCALFAGRNAGCIHFRVRRQQRGLCDARGGRHTEAT